jgi:hypothetical protein
MKPLREIKSREGVLHFQRYKIIQTPLFSIFIHKIYREDCDEHMHDHPWNFLKIILKGQYKEQYIKHGSETFRFNKPFSIRFHKATDCHKITSVSGTVTSLIFTGRRSEEWGYHIPKGLWKGRKAKWLSNAEYRKIKHK